MSVVIKYAAMPIVDTSVHIMVEVLYKSFTTSPQIIKIPHGFHTIASGNGLEDLIHNECKARFVTNNPLAGDGEISYISCDLLTPKNRVIVGKTGFFTKLWNNMKDMV